MHLKMPAERKFARLIAATGEHSRAAQSASESPGLTGDCRWGSWRSSPRSWPAASRAGTSRAAAAAAGSAAPPRTTPRPTPAPPCRGPSHTCGQRRNVSPACDEQMALACDSVQLQCCRDLSYMIQCHPQRLCGERRHDGQCQRRASLPCSPHGSVEIEVLQLALPLAVQADPEEAPDRRVGRQHKRLQLVRR